MILWTVGLRELAGVCFASVTRQRPRIATVLSRSRTTNFPCVPTGSAVAAGKTSEPSQANAANRSTNSSSVAQRVATWMSCALSPSLDAGSDCPRAPGGPACGFDFTNAACGSREGS